MTSPKVTVLMPVHNGEAHLKDAIDSILGQTFTDFEFLIIDDGSEDASTRIVETYNDPRIRLIANKNNRGTVHVLNQGIGEARGEYIARMDADDISLPSRLEKQVRFMAAHPEIGVAGTAMRLIKNGKHKNTRKQPECDERLKIQLIFSTCFFHPTVILRRSLARTHPYPDNLVYTQDYNYWTALAQLTHFANLTETLLYFREHEGQTSSIKAELQIENARAIRTSYIEGLFGSLTERERSIHHAIAENRRTLDLETAKSWLETLAERNSTTHRFPSEIFNRELSRKWWHCCRKNENIGRETLRIYRSSTLQPLFRPDALKYMKFRLRCLKPDPNQSSRKP